jgi:hypothetical protein
MRWRRYGCAFSGLCCFSALTHRRCENNSDIHDCKSAQQCQARALIDDADLEQYGVRLPLDRECDNRRPRTFFGE